MPHSRIPFVVHVPITRTGFYSIKTGKRHFWVTQNIIYSIKWGCVNFWCVLHISEYIHRRVCQPECTTHTQNNNNNIYLYVRTIPMWCVWNFTLIVKCYWPDSRHRHYCCCCCCYFRGVDKMWNTFLCSGGGGGGGSQMLQDRLLFASNEMFSQKIRPLRANHSFFSRCSNQRAGK